MNNFAVLAFARDERPRHHTNIWMLFIERVVARAYPQRDGRIAGFKSSIISCIISCGTANTNAPACLPGNHPRHCRLIKKETCKRRRQCQSLSCGLESQFYCWVAATLSFTRCTNGRNRKEARHAGLLFLRFRFLVTSCRRLPLSSSSARARRRASPPPP